MYIVWSSFSRTKKGGRLCVYTHGKVWKYVPQADNIYYIRRIELEEKEERK